MEDETGKAVAKVYYGVGGAVEHKSHDKPEMMEKEEKGERRKERGEGNGEKEAGRTEVRRSRSPEYSGAG